VAELGRIAEDDIRSLMQLPQAARVSRPAPSRKYTVATGSPEWSLLYSLLADLPMVVHIDPGLLRASQAESRALLAIRELYETSEEPPSLPVLIESLEGNPSLEAVLQASRYGDDLGLSEEEARAEMQGALGRLDEMRRKAELDSLLSTGLRSREEREAYNGKLMIYKRLQGALPADQRPSQAGA
jgi:hypothetical protein